MADTLRKVQSGDPLVIPATTFNTFVDAARDFLARQHQQVQYATPARTDNTIIRIRNNSGHARERFDILGLQDPVFDPGTDAEAFANYPVMTGVSPNTQDHWGRFCVLLEPVAGGKLAHAVIAGIVPTRVYVSEEEYAYPRADVGDTTAHLRSSPIGTAAILWRETGIGVKWALVRLGNLAPGTVFPVTLTQVGGTQGSAASPATWTYDVKDPVTGDTLKSAVNPTTAPHKWRRPSIGQMTPATFGYAHYRDAGEEIDLTLGWINEMVIQEACEGAE